MGLSWRRRRDNGKAFIVRPRGGKTISQSFNKTQNQGLSRQEQTLILKDRKMDLDEIIPEEEIKETQEKGESIEGRLISLHPSNPELDNVFVDVDSPHIYDESELNKSIDLREQQNRMVAEDKGIEIQEDINKMREEENREKASKE